MTKGELMHTKIRSLIIVFIAYILAIALGIFTFLSLETMTDISRFLIADIVATLTIFILSTVYKNASLYDPYWSVIPPVILFGAMLYYNAFGNTSLWMTLAITIWAIRLTYNWASQWHGFTDMDWRYQAMKDRAPKVYLLTNLFGIQLFPTAIVFIQLILGLKVIELNPDMTIFTWLGVLMIIVAAIIQLIADEQMKVFKERTKGQKLCIDEGLWKYSRHPNYFGEITVWWGLYVIYISIVNKLDVWILSPIMMTSLFLFISIPWMEKKIIKTRPQYKAYQKQVSMLIPFIRKESREQVTDNA